MLSAAQSQPKENKSLLLAISFRWLDFADEFTSKNTTVIPAPAFARVNFSGNPDAVPGKTGKDTGFRVKPGMTTSFADVIILMSLLVTIPNTPEGE
jgi:hypothetical protein